MIICADHPASRIITIHTSRATADGREIILYDPRGHDVKWGDLSYTVNDTDEVLEMDNVSQGPFFSIGGIDSYVSAHASQRVKDTQKGVGAVLMSLAAQEAQALGLGKMWVISVIYSAQGFYTKVGFSPQPGSPVGDIMWQGDTATILGLSLAEARKHKWSI